MTGASSGRSTILDCTNRVYGAFEPEGQKLLFVVEAEDEATALVHVGLVAPYIGVIQAAELIVVKLEELPSGVPTFFDGFFSAGRIAFNRQSVTPGTSTLQ